MPAARMEPPLPSELKQPNTHQSRSRAVERVAERYGGLPAWQVILPAAALFVLVFLCRTAEDSADIGVHLFYIVPVILLALRFGTRGGIISALVAIALYLGWTLTDGDDEIDVYTWFSPAFTVLIVGALVGYLAESLTASERHFRSAAENQLEPFVIYAPVRSEEGAIVDFRAEFINDAGADSVGLPREQITGMLLSELFPGRLEHGLLEEYIRVVETGEPYFREASDYVNVMGEETLVRTLDIRVARIEDGSGMIETTWRDITDKLRAEQERDWLAAMADQSSDAILSVDLDGRIVSWSEGATRLYGYTSEEAIGRSYVLTVADGEATARSDYLDRVLSGERPAAPVDGTERCKDGTLIRTTYIGWPIRDPSGEVIGAARIVRARGD